MFKHKGASSSNPALFDIQLKLQHKDILLLRGNEFEVDSVPMSGLVKLLLPHDMHVRKIKLTLEGEYSVLYVVKGGSFIIERLCALRVEWRNLLTSEEGQIIFGDHGDHLELASVLDKKGGAAHSRSASNISSSLHNLASTDRPLFLRSRSLPMMPLAGSLSPTPKILLPTSGCDGTPFKDQDILALHSFLLPKGNYNLPFSVVLPSNVSETVEGLPPGRLLYRLSCIIERGRFEKPLKTNKVIRIIRTLHPQSFSLTDTVEISSTWLGKLQYSISLTHKGLALGAKVPVSIIVIPMAKGLSIKSIGASLIERLNVVTPADGMLPQWERVIGTQKLPLPTIDFQNADQWNIETTFGMPHKLSEITQTCTLKNGMIEVKHRLRIGIQVKNQDGHISELRAHIPVTVYISSQVGHVSGYQFEWDPHQGFLPDRKKDVELFKRRHEENDGNDPTSAPPSGTSTPAPSDLDSFVDAPPLYQKHMLDQLYKYTGLGNSLGLDTASHSELSSPYVLNFNSPAASAMQSPNPSSLDVAGYFDVMHITTQSSGAMGLPPLLSPPLEVLNRIPSYDHAMEEDEDQNNGMDEPAPRYDGDSPQASGTVSPIDWVPITNYSETLLHGLQSQHHLAISKLLAKKKDRNV